MMIHKGALTALTATVFVSTAHATFYGTESSFLAAAGAGLSLQSFEYFVTSSEWGDRSEIVVPGFTLSTPNGNELSIDNGVHGGPHATHGIKFVLWGTTEPPTPTPNDRVYFHFSTPVDAFSFRLTDAGDLYPDHPSVYFWNDLGQTFTMNWYPHSGDEDFLGYVGSPMTTGWIRTSGNYVAGDVMGIDEVRFRAVPEPASLAMFGGLVVLGQRRWRR